MDFRHQVLLEGELNHFSSRMICHSGIYRSHSLKEIETTMADSGSQVVGGVFVQCYNDCPEEIEWVYSQARDFQGIEKLTGKSTSFSYLQSQHLQ